MAIILPPNRDAVVSHADEPVVGNGDAVRVAHQVVQHVAGAAKRRLRVDHPRLPVERAEPDPKGGVGGRGFKPPTPRSRTNVSAAVPEGLVYSLHAGSDSASAT